MNDTEWDDADGEDEMLEPLRERFLDLPESADDAERRTRELADRLFAALEGLPDEVRFQGRPATEVECAAMIQSLPWFEQLAERAGLRRRYEPLVQRCRLHFAGYQRFLQMGSPGGSYTEFQHAEDR